MKKRILLIGPENSGKKTVAGFIEKDSPIQEKQSIVYHPETILVPSAYLRSPWMTHHIIATQQNAYCVLMLLRCGREYRVYSPNFAKAFRIPVLGVIVCQQQESAEELAACQKELWAAGVDELYELRIDSPMQCQAFVRQLRKIKEGNQ